MRVKKRFVLIVLSSFLLIGGVFFYFFGPLLTGTYEFSNRSPNGNYVLVVYSTESNLGAKPSGAANSREAFVILRNDLGARLGSSKGCDLLVSDLKIEWDWAVYKREVQLAVGRNINLDSGECYAFKS